MRPCSFHFARRIQLALAPIMKATFEYAYLSRDVMKSLYLSYANLINTKVIREEWLSQLEE